MTKNLYGGVSMKENVWKQSKCAFAKWSETVAELLKLVMKYAARGGAKLVAVGAAVVARCTALAAKGLRTERMQKLRPIMKTVMCVSAAIAVVSGVLYFFSSKKQE